MRIKIKEKKLFQKLINKNFGIKLNNIDSFLVFVLGFAKDISINGLSVELGLHLINAFDESAPLVYDAPDFSFDTRLHDPRGRLLNLSIDYEF